MIRCGAPLHQKSLKWVFALLNIKKGDTISVRLVSVKSVINTLIKCQKVLKWTLVRFVPFIGKTH